jgi:hypothetical protein
VKVHLHRLLRLPCVDEAFLRLFVLFGVLQVERRGEVDLGRARASEREK